MIKGSSIRKRVKLLWISSALVFGVVMAQYVNKPETIEVKETTLCFTDIQRSLNDLYGKFEERLVFHTIVDEDDKSQIALFYNKEEKTYSLLKMTHAENDEGVKVPVVCIMSLGKMELDWKVLAQGYM
jgi:hypothetical protein